MRRIFGAWPRKTFALLIAAWSGSAPSEVTLDGSLGGARGRLPGPDFEIGADFGRLVGSNLFHSFGAFNLSDSESATFSGPNAIKNILGRVTGGSGSNINGLLRSTIPDANLFLLNPAGIVFGPSAELDVQGSFHASTGDFIRLADGRRFDAVPSANDALLTTKPPQAFGFLGRQNLAPIEVNGSFLKVPEGKTLSLAGGDIAITGGSLFQAPGGRVNVASVASAGEVTLGGAELGTRSFARLGKIDMTQGSIIDVSEAKDRATGGGRVLIRGGQFVMDDSRVLANTKDGGGKGIDIKLTDALVMKKGSSIEARTSGPGTGGDVAVKVVGRMRLTEGSRITTNTNGPGKGGMLQVAANDILLDGVAVDEKGNVAVDEQGIRNSGLFARARNCGNACGDAGRITVNAGRLRLTGGGEISASTTGGPGRAGDVDIHITEELVVEGGFTGANLAFIGSAVSVSTGRGTGPGGNLTIKAGSLRVTKRAQIRATTQGPGQGGNLTIKAGSLRVTEGAQIRVNTQGSGQGGNLTIEAGEIVLEKTIPLPGGGLIGPLIFARSEGAAKDCGKDCGDGGSITIKAERLQLKDGAEISASTLGPGKGGNLSIHAKEVILENGFRAVTTGDVSESNLTVGAQGTVAACGKDCGDAGSITIKADRLQLKQGAFITASTQGSGRGGSITIEADEVVLEGRFDTSVREGGFQAVLSARTRGSEDGGNITIKAGRLLLKGDALIRANALSPLGKGGRLTITVVGSLEVRDGAQITTSTLGDGDAGRINVKADTVKLVNRGKIASESGELDPELGLLVGHGDAGRVSVDAERLEITEGGSITTTTRGPGRGGAVSVDADRASLSGDGSRITSESTSDSPNPGQAGNITIRGRTSNSGDSLEVRNGAQITTSTLGNGDAGIINVKADTIKLLNRGRIASASGDKLRVGTGDAGRVSVDAERLEITEGGSITTTTRGPGLGGPIEVTADEIALRDGARITSESISKRRNAGRSGEISIRASDSFRLFNDSQVSVKTNRADAGDIGLDVGFLLHLRDSSITTSVAGGEGRGGNINIDPVFVVLDNSAIRADAFGGPGGNVRIVADFFFGPLQNVSASSALGIDGAVEIDSPETDLNAGLIELPESFLDAATLLTQGCAPGADLSRMVVRKYEVLPDSPTALRVPPPGGLLNADAPGGKFALTRETLGPGFEHSSACDGDG